MLRFFGVCLFMITVATNASAQQIIRNFNQDTVFRSMQCEIGLFAQRTKRSGLDPSLKAHIKYSTAGSVDAKASAEAGFGGWFGKIIQGPKLSAAYDFTRVDSNIIEGKLNLNEGNLGTCVGKRSPAIPLGIYDCLSGGLPVMLGGFTTTCSRKVTAKATFDASGKFSAWVITIGPAFSTDITVNYQIDVDAPVKPEKPDSKS